MQQTSSSAAFVSPTFESRVKGDEGVYAAMRAATLARALHGMTVSRLTLLAQLGPDVAADAAAAAAAAAAATTTTTADGSSGKDYAALLQQQQQQQAATWVSSSSMRRQQQQQEQQQQQTSSLVLGVTPATFACEGSVARVARTALHDALLRAACEGYANVTECYNNNDDDDDSNNNNNNARIVAAAMTASAAATASLLSRYRTHVPVGLPDDADADNNGRGADELLALLPRIRRLRPGKAMSYDDWLQLCALCGSTRARVCTLDLGGGATCATAHSTQPPCTTACMLAKLASLQQRYPLPPARTAANKAHDDAYDDDDDDDDEVVMARRHNAALQARCMRLGLPSEDYNTALRALAVHEMRVYNLLCDALAADIRSDASALLSESEEGRNNGNAIALAAAAADEDGDANSVAAATMMRQLRRVQVLLLDHSRLGEESATQPGTVDRAPLRRLAHALAANETLLLVDLSHNSLRASGVGVVAKALTRNIALRGLDLSYNDLYTTAAPLEEVSEEAGGGRQQHNSNSSNADEDDGEDGDVDNDPVFGELYSGCEAIAELLKKNKFLRVLRLAYNGIHAGEDATAAPPTAAEDKETDGGDEEDEHDDAAEGDGEDDVEGAPRHGQQQQHNDNITTTTTTTTTTRTAAPPVAPAAWQSLPLWQLLRPLQHYHRLEVLDLSGNVLRNTGARMLAVALARNHALRVLDVSDNSIGARGLYALAKHVVASPTSRLHTLVLRRNALAPPPRRRAQQQQQQQQQQQEADGMALRAAHALARALRHNRVLRCLILADNHLGPALCAALLSTLHTAHALEELDLSYNDACGTHPADVDVTAMHALSRALYGDDSSSSSNCSHANNGYHHNSSNAEQQQQQRRPPLRCLRLCGNNIGPAGLAVLFPPPYHAAATSSSSSRLQLREVYLARNHLGNALQPLSHALTTTCASLHTLDVSHNNIANAHALLDGLRHTRALRSLDLSHNCLGYHDALACTAMLHNDDDKATTSAHYDSSATGAAAAAAASAAAAATSASTSLRSAVTLTRSRNSTHAHACGALDELLRCVLQPTSPIECLHLGYNDLLPAHAQLLHSLLTTNSSSSGGGHMAAPQLRVLDVAHNAQLPWQLVEALVRDVAARAGLCVLRVSVHADERAEATLPLLRAVRDAALRNTALQDVCCTLAHGSAAAEAVAAAAEDGSSSRGSSGDVEAEVCELVDDIRRHLLLHALLASEEA